MTDILQLDGKELQKELDRIASAAKPRHREWTTKEIDIVKALRAKDVPYKDIAKVLDRSVGSIGALISKSPFYD